MDPVPSPTSPADALAMLKTALGFLAAVDAADLPVAVLAECVHGLERADAIEAAARARFLAAFDAQDGAVDDGQRTTRTWLVHRTRVTWGQAGEYRAVQGLAECHPVLVAGLAEGEGDVLTKSVALQLAKWTNALPPEYRAQAEQILVAASRAGADLRALAMICAEIRARIAPPDPDDDPDPDRGVSLDTTLDGAGVLRGDLTPECAALVQSVLDALSAPNGGADLRTHPERYHDALAEAMRRLLASDLLPKRAGQPVKALVHMGFPHLVELDTDSALQAKWIADYRAAWAAQRAAASVSTGDGGAWLEGPDARRVAYDAMIIPVVTADLDPSVLDDLISLCVRYHHLRTKATGPSPAARTADQPPASPAASPIGEDPADIPPGLTSAAARRARPAAAVAEMLAELEQQILGRVIQVVSGPGGVASFLRRNLLGPGLNGPSLPLDVGQTDEIPVHLRRLVALRDQRCQYPGGCDQPAAACEPHHVVHRADGGTTSLANLKNYCWWHHHVVLHEQGWTLTVHPDGTSQATSPDGRTIRSHRPPPASRPPSDGPDPPGG